MISNLFKLKQNLIVLCEMICKWVSEMKMQRKFVSLPAPRTSCRRQLWQQRLVPRESETTGAMVR
jgi:hypothetical protein